MSIFAYRQKPNEIIIFSMISPVEIDKLIGKNLKRLRLQKDITQTALGDLIGVDGNVIAQLEGALIGMGKDIMTRLCKALNIRPYEFYIEDDTPLIKDEFEKETLNIFRQARSFGDTVAENISKYGRFIIKETQKTKIKGTTKSRKVRSKGIEL